MSRAVATRAAHRGALSRHFAIMAAGVVSAFAVNRFTTPSTLWAHWVAIAWGTAFLAHAARFTRTTLATMTRSDRDGVRKSGNSPKPLVFSAAEKSNDCVE